MKINQFIFYSLLCITIPSHAMELFRKKPKQTFHNYPYEFFFIHKLFDQENRPQQAIALIQGYILLLRHQYFQKHFTHIKEWNDFCISIRYQYLLPPQQIDLLQTLFNHPPVNFGRQVFLLSPNFSGYTYTFISYKNKNEYIYVLPSKWHYKEFLKLPIQIRERLEQLPQSKIEIPLRDVDINPYKAIGFKRRADILLSNDQCNTQSIELAPIIRYKNNISEKHMHMAPQLLKIPNHKYAYLLHDPFMSERFKKRS